MAIKTLPSLLIAESGKPILRKHCYVSSLKSTYMYPALISFHAYWAIVVLVFLSALTAFAIYGFFSKKLSSATVTRLWFFSLIATHIQFLTGILVFFVSPMVATALSDMGAAMKNATLRMYAVEHPMVMILVALFITLGYLAHKKIAPRAFSTKTLVFLFISYLLMLSRIPWQNWM
jgi:hypothetical protein